jgi:hypothetical protein
VRRNYPALTDGNLVDCTGAAAEQARRPDPTVIHQERGFNLAAQQPDLVVEPKEPFSAYRKKYASILA